MEDAEVLPMQPAPDAIELRHLRAFVAVAEELNFRPSSSSASGRLGAVLHRHLLPPHCG
jgi:hypothetical protein